MNWRLFAVIIVSIIGTYGYELVPESALTPEDECHYSLNLTNDGPVTLDVPITIAAKLNCAGSDVEYYYIFKDNASPAHFFEMDGNSSASATFLYQEEKYNYGYFLVTVSAYLKLQQRLVIKVATKTISIRVAEHIPGSLVFKETTRRETEPNVVYIATNQTSNLTLNILYPPRFYEDAEFTYSWNIGKQLFISDTPFRLYKFSEAGTFDIVVSAVARVPVYDRNFKTTAKIKYKWGYYRGSVIVKNPFHAINLTGNTYLKHGQLLNLDVSCNGSGPIDYCWKVLKSTENQTNITCSALVSTSECSFPVIYYFHVSGDYVVSLYVDNYVTNKRRNVEVHIYDVSLRPQLSTVLVPLTCVILAIIIVALALVFHFKRRERFGVEIADFDIMESEPFSLETFWEQMFRSLLHVFCIDARFKSRMDDGIPTRYGSTSDATRQRGQ